ncbi:mRNA binding protein puf3 [Elasticomyces elasticus]|nr:mRNA binding protein puf3 [Elasticomyces elasticus]
MVLSGSTNIARLGEYTGLERNNNTMDSTTKLITGVAAFSSAFGKSADGWGRSKDIWGSGSLSRFGSAAATRDSSRTRDTPFTMLATESAETKTGSGLLVDSSTADGWIGRHPSWSAQGNGSSLRTSSQARQTEATSSQQCNQSIAGASQAFAGSFSSTCTLRPAAVTSSAFNNANFPSTVTSRGSINGPTNGFGKTSSGPGINGYSNGLVRSDTAMSSWGESQSIHSPTDDRRSTAGSDMFRVPSIPVSRTGSVPASRHSDEQPQWPPKFEPPARLQQYQSAAVNRDHIASLSSPNHETFSGRFESQPNQLIPQFGQMKPNLENDYHSLVPHKPSMPVNGYSSHYGNFQSQVQYPRQALSVIPQGHVQDDDVDQIVRTGMDSASRNGWSTPHLFRDYIDYDRMGYDTRQYAPTFPANGTLSSLHSQANGFRPNELQSLTTGQSLLLQRKLREVQDQQAFLAPQIRHMMTAQQFRTPQDQQTFSAPHAMAAQQLRNQYVDSYVYGMQMNGMQPYHPMAALPAIEPPRGPRDTDAGSNLRSALLEEYKSNSKTSKRYELKDIYDHVVEFSGDQHGSRFIQQKLETANSDEKERVFREIEENALQLMQDVFGNYVIQKFFEHGDQGQKKILANRMKGHVLQLSLQMYGCRVVQKALEHILTDQQAILIRELEHHVLKCVKDQNGNHVIQKAIERCPPQTIAFILSAFVGQVGNLAIHSYGCRVIQRMLEYLPQTDKRVVMVELHACASTLVPDVYGNYVTQHIVEHGEPQDRDKIMKLVLGGLEGYAKHKFASNVVEKCLVCGSDEWRREVVKVLARGCDGVGGGAGAGAAVAFLPLNGLQERGESVLMSMIKDNYGNYVIQKLLDTLAAHDYNYFMSILQQEMARAKRTGCGKQVLSIEKRMHRYAALPSPSAPYTHGYNSQHQQHQQQHPQNQHQHLHRPLQNSQHNPQQMSQQQNTNADVSIAPTPPPPSLTPGTSLQNSSLPSVDGDAVEGAVCLGKETVGGGGGGLVGA